MEGDWMSKKPETYTIGCLENAEYNIESAVRALSRNDVRVAESLLGVAKGQIKSALSNLWEDDDE